MTSVFGKLKKTVLLAALTLIVVGTTGCHRGEQDFDDRTLAQRPHVETVKPDDRKDIFRPSGN